MPELEELYGVNTFVVREFLSPRECLEWVNRSHTIGYVDAPITTPRGPLMRPDIRNNTRAMADRPTWAHELWLKAKGYKKPRKPTAVEGGSSALV